MSFQLGKGNKIKKEKFIQKYQQQESSQEEHEYEFIEQTQNKIQNLKMISFIDHLYSKYKVLNKLNEEESNNFQNQVIQMLIDQNENVDTELYKQTVEKIGLSTFILEILGSILQKRNKFKNQHQMSRNIEEITKQIQKQQQQLTKRKKQLDKREILIKKREAAVIQSIKLKVLQMQQKSKNSILSVQTQLKKRMNNVLSSVKIKQKQILDKFQSLRQSIKKIKDFQQEQKSLDEKIKILDKKYKQRKFRETSQKSQQNLLQQSNKKIEQMKIKVNQLEQTNKKLDQQIKKSNKKIRTNQMAYKHFKQDTDDKLSKYYQVKQQINLLKEECQKLKKQIQNIRVQKQQLLKSNQGLKKSYKISIKQKQVSLKQFQDQKRQKVVLKQKIRSLQQGIKSNTKHFNEIQHFQVLDISKIQNEMFNNQQRQFMADRQFDDKSVLHNIAESILISHQNQSEQIHQIQKTIDLEYMVSQTKNNMHDLSDEQQQSIQDERRYFDIVPIRQNIKQNKMNKKIQKQSQFKKFIRQKSNHKNNHKQQNNKQMKQLKQLEKLKQISSDENDSFLIKKQNQQKIAIFDNYFKDLQDQNHQLPNQNKTKKENNQNQQLQEQLNKFVSQKSIQSCQTLTNLNPQHLQNWIIIISQNFKYSKPLVQTFMQILLRIIQPCSCPTHQKCIKLLFTKQTVSFLEQVFVKFQGLNNQIQQKSILIISRLLLSYENVDENLIKFTLSPKYLKSLKIKLLIEKDQFIKSNIKFLMEYQ